MILPDAPTVDAWRARAHSLEAISGAQDIDVELRDGQRLETVKGGAMSATLLPMLGVHPALGRGFAPTDEHPGAAAVAMLGYGVSGRDPLTYTAIVALLGATALLAVYLPTRRAMRVDPVVALSAE